MAVALSGGGDSVALTLLAAEWCRERRRPLTALTVDHGLQPQSPEWVAACRRLAEREGLGFRALHWVGPKPATGLPAAAREARHRLLAGAARDLGAAVILMGHTADDLAEAAAMRAAGSTTPDPREWAPSPAWPEGRGVFLLRPLLGVRRPDLRAWLRARGETWIEDPANDNLAFARARARAGAPPPQARAHHETLTLAAEVVFDGGLHLDRETFRGAPMADAVRLCAMAALCAAGTARPPARERAARLALALAGHGAVAASLSGARITADAQTIRWDREPGESARGGLAPLTLKPGETAVWDGRYEVRTDRTVEVRALRGAVSRLSEAAGRLVAAAPAGVRGGLPVVETGNGLACPTLEPAEGLTLRPLALDRLHAAAGLHTREP